MYDLLARRRPGSRLFGFLNGPRGITQGDAREITAAALVRRTFVKFLRHLPVCSSHPWLLLCHKAVLAVRTPGHSSRRSDARTLVQLASHDWQWLTRYTWQADAVQRPAGARSASRAALTSGKTLCCLHQLQCLMYLQAPFRNQGGFNIIGSGRDKIESPEQLAACGRHGAPPDAALGRALFALHCNSQA